MSMKNSVDPDQLASEAVYFLKKLYAKSAY